MDEVARQIFLFGVAAAGTVALFVALGALFPRRIGRARALVEAMPGRAFLVGLVNFIFFGGIALALFGLAERVGAEPLKAILSVPALILLLLLTIGLSFGLAGVVSLVGQRLASRPVNASEGEEGLYGWKRTAAGALVVGLACLAPFAGWFVLGPYVALTGLGSFILSLLGRDTRRP